MRGIKVLRNLVTAMMCSMAYAWTAQCQAFEADDLIDSGQSESSYLPEGLLASEVMTTLFAQPQVSDIRTVTYNHRSAPAGTLGIILWGGQEKLGPSGYLNQLTPYTGLTVQAPLNLHQMVVNPGWPGGTGVQTMGGRIGINIHSQSIAQNMAARGGLGTVVLGYNFKAADRIKPFTRLQNKLRYFFEMKVPRSYVLGQGVTQVVAYFNFVDVVHNQAIWYGFNAFDSRGLAHLSTVGPESVMWDLGTNLPIVHSTFGYSHNFGTTDFGSQSFLWWTFGGFRPFSMTVSGSQLANAIRSIKLRYPALANRLSDNPADYELRHFNFNPEIYTPNAAHFAHIGVTERNLRIDWIH